MNRVGCHYLIGLTFRQTDLKRRYLDQIPLRKEIVSVFQGKGVDMETTDEDGDSLQEVARVMNRDGNFDDILTLLRSSLNNQKGAENFLHFHTISYNQTFEVSLI